jgi:DHA2 family multidrug resistance protein-like MFS transporter
MLLCGVGFSLFNVSNNRNLFLSAPRERSGTAGGLQSVARSTGQTLGAVLMTILLAAYPLGSAPRVGLAIAALLTLAAGVTSTMRVGGKANQPNG